MRVLRDVDGVLFDAGGVLVMPDPQIIVGLLDTFSLDASVAACHRLHYLRVHLYDELAPRDWGEVDNQLVRHLGLRGEAAQHAAHLLTSTFGHHRSVVGPGVLQVLRGLQDSGKALGVVSNSDGTLAARLAEDGLYSEDGTGGSPVTFVVDSTVVGVAKPSLRIFGVAIERLEALGVDHQRCVFVGDTVSNDVLPAEQAGFIPIHLDPYGLCDGRNHRHISSLQELTSG